MKVVVTGGSGRLGGLVVREFLEHGYDVLSLDRIVPPAPPCSSWIADLTRAGDIYQALHGADSVVHLAAYQAPDLAPDSETFANNVTGTYNILKAATDLDVTHVVLASSIAAYGYISARRMLPPAYLPLDEDHPCVPEDPYGLSKIVGEATADSFARLRPMSIASLRLPGITFDLTYASWPDRWRNPTRRLGGFWSYIDARDAATACRLAAEASLDGHQVLNVAAPTSSMREPTTELVQRYLPGVGRLKEGLNGNWSGMDSSRAEQVRRFQAQHTWERYVDPATLPPG